LSKTKKTESLKSPPLADRRAPDRSLDQQRIEKLEQKIQPPLCRIVKSDRGVVWFCDAMQSENYGESQHRRFVTSAFTVAVAGDHRLLNIRAGSEIFVVTADIELGKTLVRFTMKDRFVYIEADRAILLRSTRR
jgi:hypothetical protein